MRSCRDGENKFEKLENLSIMSFSKNQLNETLKLAKEKVRLNEIKVTPSGGSMFIGDKRFTDHIYADRELNKDKKNKK